MRLLDFVAGNRSRLPFTLLYSLRSLAVQRRAVSFLSLMALSASVCLAVSVELSTRSVNRALEGSANALAGAAQLEVSAGDTRIPESLVDEVRSVAGVRSASPVIQRTFRISGGPHDGEAVRIVAIDLLYDNEVRDYRMEQGGFTIRDPLRLMARKNAIVIATQLADRLDLSDGDTLLLRSVSGEHSFMVRGLLSGALSEAFGGQIAVADLYGMQSTLELGPSVDRIDIALDEGVGKEAAIERIGAVVGEAATVRHSSLREDYVDSVMATLNMTVWSVAFVGVLISLFLTYSVMSLTVERRLEELSLLRAAGMQGRTVTALIWTDAALLSLLATGIGFLAAVTLSDSFVSVFSRASSYLQQVEIEPVVVQASTLWVALLVGLPVALLASLEPGLRAGRRSPLEFLLARRSDPEFGSTRWSLVAVGLVACASTISLWLVPDLLSPAPRLALSVLSGVLAVVAGLSQLLLAAFPKIQRFLGLLSPRIGFLVGSSLRERPVETGATIAVWAAVTGTLLAVSTLIHSLATSVDEYWIGLNGAHAVMVFGEDPLDSQNREPIRNSTIDELRGAPGVVAVAPYYNILTLVRGEQVQLESLATSALEANSGGALTISDDPRATLAALLRGELVMTKSFAHHFDIHIGDSLTLVTNTGPRSFRIGGYVRAYAGAAGLLSLDLPVFKKWFPRSGAEQVALWTQRSTEEGVDAVRQHVRSQALFYRYGEAFQKHTARVLAKFNDLLMLPVFLMASIGTIALMNLLFSNVVSRQRDFAVLRASGATPADVIGIVIGTAAFIGVLGTVCGLLLAYPWAQIISQSVSESMGYEIRTTIDVRAFAWLAVGSIALSGLSGLVPALRGRARVPRGITALS